MKSFLSYHLALSDNKHRRRIILGGLSAALVLIAIIAIPVYFATRPETVAVIETKAEETLPSLIKVAPLGTAGAILIEYTESLEDHSNVFYYLNAQDLNLTTVSNTIDLDNIALYLTTSGEPSIEDISKSERNIRLRQRKLIENRIALRIGLINSVDFPFRLPGYFLPGDFNGAILIEETPENIFVEVSKASFSVLVDPERNVRDFTVSNTPSPTLPPTTPPTAATLIPSKNPTVFPTMAQSESPSSTPTQEPSKGPEGTPSSEPTTTPSVNPTLEPTTNPTSTPSISPQPTLRGATRSPTESPSSSPTENPTLMPSHNPTSMLSPTPTDIPSRSPSGMPSQNPTLFSTMEPTDKPSQNPTNLTTPQPTRSPTNTPTSPVPQLPQALEAELSGSYNIGGTISIDYVQEFRDGQVVDVPRLRFNIPALADAPGPYLYLSKRSYSDTRRGDLGSDDIFVPIDGGTDGQFNVNGRFDQLFDEIENVQDLAEYTNGSWIVWCRPFGVWIGGGAISAS